MGLDSANIDAGQNFAGSPVINVFLSVSRILRTDKIGIDRNRIFQPFFIFQTLQLIKRGNDPQMIVFFNAISHEQKVAFKLILMLGKVTNICDVDSISALHVQCSASENPVAGFRIVSDVFVLFKRFEPLCQHVRMSRIAFKRPEILGSDGIKMRMVQHCFLRAFLFQKRKDVFASKRVVWQFFCPNRILVFFEIGNPS